MQSERPTKLRELAATGYSDPEIADMFGVSSRTILRWRQDQGIESYWTPPRRDVRHGTEHTYKNHKCRCGPCRRAVRSAQAARLARYARETGRNAIHHGEPWTPGDDAVILLHRPLEAAHILGRTYAAVQQRGRVLRARAALQHALAAAQRQEDATG